MKVCEINKINLIISRKKNRQSISWFDYNFLLFLDAANISLRKLDPFVRSENLDQHAFYFLSFFKLQESLQTDKEIRQRERERECSSSSKSSR